MSNITFREARMRVQKLAGSWYPARADEVEKAIDRYPVMVDSMHSHIFTPHAGWTYSGEMIYNGIQSIDENTDLIFVLGGHRNDDAPCYIYPYDSWETPLGSIKIQQEIQKEFSKKIQTQEEPYNENSIEVILPMIKYRFPQASIFPIRPSFYQIEKIVEFIESIESKAVICSGDMSHYGRVFGYDTFGPPSKEVVGQTMELEKRLFPSIKTKDIASIRKLCLEELVSCSAASLSYFSLLADSENLQFPMHRSSYEIQKGESFVNYVLALG
jgi:AmmeMemoRadiSam system protein B